MKRMKWNLSITLTILIILISGCSQSEEEALKEARTIAESTFNSNSVEVNQDLEHFSLYLPNNFEIIEETQSNLILEKSDQTYILFYNALEETTSELNYQAAESAGHFTLLESFENSDRFGYIGVVSSEEEDTYELQIGVGGVKITTYTSVNDMEEDAEAMMQMANSIAYTSQEQ
ncbi:hypothetical protein [Aquibacillus rhizosphaerae]|uniref:Lipoprotein n=1 Tax=Aquibacillus rhizosphaerae TaxID=3051431 RepID=A0ABT7L0S9_9BACI|nr:hypothetical protein [Aquibacillus sp. LR5S19]MDL4839387.1 hypothetical protein [Aquibacillus sp. LR5S19]